MKLKIDKFSMEETLHLNEIEQGVNDDIGIDVEVPEELYHKYHANIKEFVNIQEELRPYWKDSNDTTASSDTAILSARGLLVLDPDLETLAGSLQDRNIRIIQLESSIQIATFEKRKAMLSNRIIVIPWHKEDLIMDASSLDMGIVIIEDVLDSVSSPTDITKIISDAIIKYSLWPKRHGYVLTLKENGQHEYRDLVD